MSNLAPHIVLPVAELKPALIGLGKIIGKRTTLPVLSNIKIERTKDGWVALSATDLDRCVTVRLEQPGEGEPIALLIPYEDLQAVTKSCDRADTLTVESVDENRAVIRYPVGTQTIEHRCASLPVAEFPEIPKIKGEAIALPDRLRQAIHEALQCASTDETRIIINGAYLDVSDPKCQHVVGTDGHHLFSSNSFTLPRLLPCDRPSGRSKPSASSPQVDREGRTRMPGRMSASLSGPASLTGHRSHRYASHHQTSGRRGTPGGRGTSALRSRNGFRDRGKNRKPGSLGLVLQRSRTRLLRIPRLRFHRNAHHPPHPRRLLSGPLPTKQPAPVIRPRTTKRKEATMADYFTNFSMILPLPSAEAQQYADDLAQQALYIRMGDKAMPDDFPESLKEVVDDWCFETEANHPSNGPGLWLHSSDGGIDAVHQGGTGFQPQFLDQKFRFNPL